MATVGRPASAGSGSSLAKGGNTVDPVQAAVFIGAVYTVGLSPIFNGKAVEERSKAKSAAAVEIARSTGNAPGAHEVVEETRC